METVIRAPRRILVRGSKFKVGQKVRVDGDSCGDYFGVVIERHVALTKPVSSYDDRNETKPGVTVRVSRWEGVDVSDDRMEIVAWDDETTAL